MKTKLLTLTLLALFATNASPECVGRTTTSIETTNKMDAFSDVIPVMTPMANGKMKCSITARVLYKLTWYTTAGEAVGPDDGTANVCVDALEYGVRQFLATRESVVYAGTQQVCTDEKLITVRPVEKGEIIRQSEVQPDPDMPRYFEWKDKVCAKFIQNVGRSTYKGVICKVADYGTYSAWKVVDLY
jgi:hypothetical protein